MSYTKIEIDSKHWAYFKQGSAEYSTLTLALTLTLTSFLLGDIWEVC
jgi:hypothetical protein